MNINKFNANIRDVSTAFKVLKSQYSSDKKLKFLSLALGFITKLMKVDTVTPSVNASQLARRIFCYYKIKEQVQVLLVKNPTLDITLNPILNSLASKIDSLKLIMGPKVIIPSSFQNLRSNYNTKIKNILNLSDHHHIHYIEREFFSQTADNFFRFDKKTRDLYSGLTELHSLKSWKKILKFHIERTQQYDKEIFSLLKQIKKAIPIALKTTTGIESPSNQIVREMKYFKNWNRLNTSSEKPPQFAIVNDISRDISNLIDEIKPNKKKLFILGILGHAVAVQILCKQRPDLHQKGQYEYQVFNTGYGVSHFHRLNQARDRGYPLTYVNLTRESISQTFISQLVDYFLNSSDIDAFYALHDDHLVNIGKGNANLKKGPTYKLQQNENCVTLCIESCIYSNLNNSHKFDELEQSKIMLASSRMKEAIKIISTDPQTHKISKKRKKHSLAYLPPAKRLRIDRLLLDCSDVCLKEP